MTTKHRAKLARRNAGLSVGQAAKLLDLTTAEVIKIDETDEAFADADHARLADVYAVNLPWLRGEVEQYDYERMNKVPGFADLESTSDKAILAEFAASIPCSDKSADDRLDAVRKKKP